MPCILYISVLDEWKKLGGEDWQLLEPVDGFHSNQVYMYYI